MTENETKPWTASVTVWGGVAAALSPLLRLLGYEVDAAALGDGLAALAAVVGGALAVWGRLRASQAIRRV